MGLLEFNKLPINTLVGADWKTFKDITGGRDIGAATRQVSAEQKLSAACCPLWLLCRTDVMKSSWQISPWSMIRYSFWDIGVAGLRLCIMFSPATSISATTRHTRLYFRIL